MKKLLLALATFAFLATAHAKADEPAKADTKMDKPAKKAKKGKKGKKAMKKDEAAPPAK